MKAMNTLILAALLVGFSQPALSASDTKIDFNSMIKSGLDKKKDLHADVSEMMEVEKTDVNPKSSDISDFIGNELKALDAQSKVVKARKKKAKKGL